MDIYKDIAQVITEQYKIGNEIEFNINKYDKNSNIGYIVSKYWKGLDKFTYLINKSETYTCKISEVVINGYEYNIKITERDRVPASAIIKALKELYSEIKTLTETAKYKTHKTGLKSITECRYTTKKRSDTGQIQTYINAIKVNGEWQKSHYSLHAVGNTIKESQELAFGNVMKRAAETEIREKLSSLGEGSHIIELENFDLLQDIEIEITYDNKIVLIGYASKFNEEFTENKTFDNINSLIEYLIDINDALHAPDPYYFGEYKIFKVIKNRALMEAIKPKNKTQLFQAIMSSLRAKDTREVSIELNLPYVVELKYETMWNMAEYEIENIQFITADGEVLEGEDIPTEIVTSRANEIANTLAIKAMELNSKGVIDDE